jgi:very-short-patch-repair endonuclease
MSFQRQAGQTKRARDLRQQENPAEASMWTVLKDRQLGGHKFVRQLPIGPSYADFVCRSVRLVLEIDGSQHVACDYDRRRDQFMAAKGYAVLRIPSALVLRQRREVCDTILAAIEGRITDNIDTLDMKYLRPSPTLRVSPPASGRGEDPSLLPLAGEEAREARR